MKHAAVGREASPHGHAVTLTFPIDSTADVRLLEHGTRLSVVLTREVTKDKADHVARAMLLDAERDLADLK